MVAAVPVAVELTGQFVTFKSQLEGFASREGAVGLLNENDRTFANIGRVASIGVSTVGTIPSLLPTYSALGTKTFDNETVAALVANAPVYCPFPDTVDLGRRNTSRRVVDCLFADFDLLSTGL